MSMYLYWKMYKSGNDMNITNIFLAPVPFEGSLIYFGPNYRGGESIRTFLAHEDL